MYNCFIIVNCFNTYPRREETRWKEKEEERIKDYSRSQEEGEKKPEEEERIRSSRSEEKKQEGISKFLRSEERKEFRNFSSVEEG